MITSRRPKDPLQIEADLFAAIATMDKLSKYFDKGLVEETLLRRQLKACISDVFKARLQLERSGFDIQEFITREKLHEKYPEGMRRLDLAEGLDEDSVSLEYKELKELPARSADYVANAIELIDLLKLRTVARVEYIIPLLDEMKAILDKFPKIDASHWSVVEITGWVKTLSDERPSKVLGDDQCEKLEFDAVRWLNEFRRQLKEL
ncbi:MAG: hypothetical protein ACW99A_08820 [Candidatus Kariarchaeaceae archaeon]|jgi:hypothetical protein